jgi:rRNA maturation protein Nop10
MTPECRFILPNGQLCRGAALRHQDFCRHHGHLSAVPGPPPVSKHDRYSPLAYRRALGRSLPWIVREEIPSAIYEILHSLTEKDPAERIADRTAGHYLRLLLQRLGDVPFPNPGEAGPPLPRPRSPLPLPVAHTSAVAPDLHSTLAMLPSMSQNPDPRDFRDLISAMKEKGLLAPDWQPALKPSRP